MDGFFLNILFNSSVNSQEEDTSHTCRKWWILGFFICLDLACVCVLGAGEALEVLEGVEAVAEGED